MTPAGQRWTRDKPTVAGWYWFRGAFTDGCLVMARVICSGQEWRCDLIYDSVTMLPEQDDEWCEWQGPLTPNEATE